MQQEVEEEQEEEVIIIKSKKKGRKPKGGKIISQYVPMDINKETKTNVILHLKCSLRDLSKHTDDFDSFQFNNTRTLEYEVIQMKPVDDDDDIEEEEETSQKNTNHHSYHKDLWKKLKTLEQNLHINNVSDKKSACFWCTHDFDNPPIYIPKFHIKDSYHVYGCFCSPECATAFLMEENIDSSTRFERYHLLNHIYSKIYNYTKNIKPAPNPFYMLNKFYGNLTIQEYRSLLKNDRLFLVVDKPLTRILPELHEDNDDFIINNKVIPSHNFQIKKAPVKKQAQSKAHIMNEKFGMAVSAVM